MPSQKNIQLVKELKEKLAKAKSVVLADYKGLNVGQMTELRQKIKEAGGELKVIKNTLAKLAFFQPRGLKQVERTPGLENLTGPTAILFSYDDEVAPIKALYEFFEKNSLPKIKLGFLNQDLLQKEKVIELAKLPTREVLQAKLVGTLNSPIYGLVYVLKGNLASLINVLKAIKDAKHTN